MNAEWGAEHKATRRETQDWLRAIAVSGPQAAFVALRDGAPVGVALLVENDLQDPSSPYDLATPWLSSLLVWPEARRAGVGGQLIGAVVDAAAARRQRRLHLYCQGEDLIAYYRKRGFVPHAPYRQDGVDFQIMKRSIDALGDARTQRPRKP